MVLFLCILQFFHFAKYCIRVFWATSIFGFIPSQAGAQQLPIKSMTQLSGLPELSEAISTSGSLNNEISDMEMLYPHTVDD